VKKPSLFLFLILGLLFSGCAMTVPLNPSLLMLLKDDAPPVKLDIVPQSNVTAPANPSPAEIAQRNAAALS
jgi:hypothetical protein